MAISSLWQFCLCNLQNGLNGYNVYSAVHFLSLRKGFEKVRRKTGRNGTRGERRTRCARTKLQRNPAAPWETWALPQNCPIISVLSNAPARGNAIRHSDASQSRFLVVRVQPLSRSCDKRLNLRVDSRFLFEQGRKRNRKKGEKMIGENSDLIVSEHEDHAVS